MSSEKSVPERERWVITLEPVKDPLFNQTGHERAGIYRLRLALKTLLRSFGLRCVSVRPETVSVAH